jgi:signal transduction histidine kinase/integral membrane sensor domain MASE1
MTRQRGRYLAQLGGLAALYLGAARLGLALDPVGGFATLVWPPTGLALAALLGWGPRLWPGVALGAWLANAWAGAPPPVAAGIAVGNTLEAVVGAWALRRVGFRPALDRVRDVGSLFLLAAVLSTAVSATLGVASLWAGGVLPAARVGLAWGAWWLGDLMGALVVTPLLLTWGAGRRGGAAPGRVLEALALAVSLAAVGLFVFIAEGLAPEAAEFQAPYLVFPGLLWAAIRFGPRGAATANFAVLAIAVWGTALGAGPFAGPTLSGRLMHLQAFMAVVTLTVLVLAAVIAERRRAEVERASLLAQEQAARAEAEAAHRHAAFLAEVSRQLAASLDYEATLATVSRLAVPYLADYCVVDLVEADGSIRRVAVAHADPAKEPLARELYRYPPDPAGAHLIARALQGGRAGIATEVAASELEAIARDPVHLRVLRELGLTSYMVVLLVARGRTLGALTFAASGSGCRYGPADLAVAEDLARRAALAVDNARLYHEAQEAVRARDEFLSIASHELKTPLTTLQAQIQFLLQTIRKGAGASIPLEQFARILDTAERQGKRFASLIEELLDVSRIVAGRFALELEHVDLAQLVRSVLASFETEVARSGSPVTLTLGAPVVGRWDRLRLEQVVANLLSNAVKYGAGRPIEVNLEADGGSVRLTLRDRGIGIAPEDQARIFERFERAVSGQHYGGLGMGLYITRQIVEAHGGSIQVESEGPGKGATFVVRLPAAAAEGQAA